MPVHKNDSPSDKQKRWRSKIYVITTSVVVFDKCEDLEEIKCCIAFFGLLKHSQIFVILLIPVCFLTFLLCTFKY